MTEAAPASELTSRIEVYGDAVVFTCAKLQQHVLQPDPNALQNLAGRFGMTAPSKVILTGTDPADAVKALGPSPSVYDLTSRGDRQSPKWATLSLGPDVPEADWLVVSVPGTRQPFYGGRSRLDEKSITRGVVRAFAMRKHAAAINLQKQNQRPPQGRFTAPLFSWLYRLDPRDRRCLIAGSGLSVSGLLAMEVGLAIPEPYSSPALIIGATALSLGLSGVPAYRYLVPPHHLWPPRGIKPIKLVSYVDTDPSTGK